jgi:predicted XRE-type DNA-binding protein
MSIQVFESVWDALERHSDGGGKYEAPFDPDDRDQRAVSAWRVTQMDAARRLGVTQPRLNDLLRGRVGKFSLDALVALAVRAGLAVHLEITLAA